MNETEPINYCDLCGYHCEAIPGQEGRTLMDIEGIKYKMNDDIDCCKARKILIYNPNHPKNLARSIVVFKR